MDVGVYGPLEHRHRSVRMPVAVPVADRGVGTVALMWMRVLVLTVHMAVHMTVVVVGGPVRHMRM